jgi:hypothetical protein
MRTCVLHGNGFGLQARFSSSTNWVQVSPSIHVIEEIRKNMVRLIAATGDFLSFSFHISFLFLETGPSAWLRGSWWKTRGALIFARIVGDYCGDDGTQKMMRGRR